MSTAWALCPVCGKSLLVTPQNWPAEPPELKAHVEGHKAEPAPKRPAANKRGPVPVEKAATPPPAQ
jgi:hypothetical protein